MTGKKNFQDCQSNFYSISSYFARTAAAGWDVVSGTATPAGTRRIRHDLVSAAFPGFKMKTQKKAKNWKMQSAVMLRNPDSKIVIEKIKFRL